MMNDDQPIDDQHVYNGGTEWPGEGEVTHAGLLDLVRRLAGDDYEGSPNGCPCHCNFCGGSTDDWRGWEHDDDCPWVEAKKMLDPTWEVPEAEWLQPCEGEGEGEGEGECDCPVGEGAST